jgi:hypothetical protein
MEEKMLSFNRLQASFGFLITALMMLVLTGPLFADQSRTSATKARLSSLKRALFLYKSDLGHFPFAFTDSEDANAYFAGLKSGMGYTPDANCLIKADIAGFGNLGLSKDVYSRRWKGPYMDEEPEAFMYDYWGMPFIYLRYEDSLYLWSAGQDGIFDNVTAVVDTIKYGGDDIVISIARFRKALVKDKIDSFIIAANARCREDQKYKEPGVLQKFLSGIMRQIFLY